MKRSSNSALNESPNKKAKIAASLETHGLPKNLSKYLPLNNLSFLRAAEEGDLEMLKYLCENLKIRFTKKLINNLIEIANNYNYEYMIEYINKLK